MSKYDYSTNWMGPISLDWYKERGLTTMVTYVCDSETIRDMLRKRYPEIEVGDGYELEEASVHYSCGRIDVRGGDTGPYGDEIGVPPMRSEDWQDFGGWLDDFQTHDMWSLSDLVEQYEQESGKKIRWWKENEENSDND